MGSILEMWPSDILAATPHPFSSISFCPFPSQNLQTTSQLLLTDYSVLRSLQIPNTSKGLTKHCSQMYPASLRESTVRSFKSKSSCTSSYSSNEFSQLMKIARKATSEWFNLLKGRRARARGEIWIPWRNVWKGCPAVRMLWGSPHWGEQWLKIALDPMYLKGNDENVNQRI